MVRKFIKIKHVFKVLVAETSKCLVLSNVQMMAIVHIIYNRFIR